MSIQTDTIAAVATPAGPGAIGILRLSGPRAAEIAGTRLMATAPEKTAGMFTRGWTKPFSSPNREEAAACVYPDPVSTRITTMESMALTMGMTQEPTVTGRAIRATCSRVSRNFPRSRPSGL